mgnify:CR=1 FL=1
MKICSKCEEVKHIDDFYKDCTTKDGLAYQCKSCAKAKDKAHRQTDGYKKKLRQKRWAEQGINITYEQYEQLLEEQNGQCAICGTDENQFNKGMCVDHCHETGQIRGLLCTECNLGIGYLKDEAELLMKAAEYLTGSRWVVV